MKFYMTTFGLFAHKNVQRNNHIHLYALTRSMWCKLELVEKCHFVCCKIIWTFRMRNFECHFLGIIAYSLTQDSIAITASFYQQILSTLCNLTNGLNVMLTKLHEIIYNWPVVRLNITTFGFYARILIPIGQIYLMQAPSFSKLVNKKCHFVCCRMFKIQDM